MRKKSLIEIDHYDYIFWQFILILVMFAMMSIRFAYWLKFEVLEDED